MKKLIANLTTGAAAALALPAVAFAHVVVTPNQANVGQSLLFTISVPNERSSDVTSVKLDIPAGVSAVQPSVQTGWTIATSGTPNVTAVAWTGDIPVGQRADLTFKAQVPAKAGELHWQAFQTYADGAVVSWDQPPSANEKDNDAATSGPYSITKVADDLTSASDTSSNSDSNKTTLALTLSIIALALSVLAFLQKRRK